MKGNGLGFEREGKVQRKKSSQHGSRCLLLKKPPKGSRAPIMGSLTIHAQQ
jgi:hypothetical protein